MYGRRAVFLQFTNFYVKREELLPFELLLW